MCFRLWSPKERNSFVSVTYNYWTIILGWCAHGGKIQQETVKTCPRFSCVKHPRKTLESTVYCQWTSQRSFHASSIGLYSTHTERNLKVWYRLYKILWSCNKTSSFQYDLRVLQYEGGSTLPWTFRWSQYVCDELGATRKRSQCFTSHAIGDDISTWQIKRGA